METIIDKFGRVVIPKKIREHLGLHPGAKMRIEERKNALLMYVEESKPLLEYKDGILVYMGKPAGDLSDAIKKTREERAAKFFF